MCNFELHPLASPTESNSPPIINFVDNPGYNLARGPVSLFALRLHAEF
jgi:hypothetical protein